MANVSPPHHHLDSIDPTLAERARQSGVATSYETSDRDRRVANPEAVRAVLEALGPAETEQVCPPVVVAWRGRGRLDVKLEGPLDVVIECEDGSERRAHGTGPTLELPPMPLGYHRGVVTSAGRTFETTIIAAPNRCFTGALSNDSSQHEEGTRRWGTFAPLYAIGRSTGSGCGDLRDLETLCRITSERGGSLVGTLPLLSAFHGAPKGTEGLVEISPYAPVSRLHWNPLYIDIEAVAGYSSLPATTRERLSAGYAALRSGEHVDHVATMRHLQPALAELATLESPRAKADREHHGVDDFADFLAATVGGEASVHAFCQREIRRQLRALSARVKQDGVSLYLDLPVGSHPQGYDTNRFASSFASNLSCGAPPDLLSAGGQDWGFPPLHPSRSRAEGYALFRQIIAGHCALAGILRIDHVMWMHRIYCIAQGFDAKDGVYVHYNADELWAIVCLESHRHQTIIVGEDLGTVPDAVRMQMDRRGALGMHLFQFGLGHDPHDAIAEPKPNTVASLGTHDTPPFTAFWSGADIDLSESLGHQTSEEARINRADRELTRQAVLTTLADRRLIGDKPRATSTAVTTAALDALSSSRAAMVLVSIEDLLEETRPQNVPGTTTEVANWTRRARVPIDQLDDHPSMSVLGDINSRRQANSEPMSLRAAARRQPRTRADVTAVSSDDLHLFGEGTHLQAFDFLGAHPCEVDGLAGSRFGVWAPNATAVSVIGDWNHWKSDAHPLEARGVSGVWEGFVAGALCGDRYKFALETTQGMREKADPVAFRTEGAPKTGSVISRLDFEWSDHQWMKERAERSAHGSPISIYELHLGSFMRRPEEGNRWLGYAELGERIADHVCALGFTHVELLPVMEHPFYGSWGYQTTSYFAPSARYGTPAELMGLIDTLHGRGIAVILDWVPSHFPNDAFALAEFDGTHLYEHADPRLGFHPDWQSCIFNLGRNEVRSFLISSALFWLHHYHIDGIRVDAVASMLYRDYSRKEGEWIPNQFGGRENLEAVAFLRQLNEAVYSRFPDVQTYAEESTAWPGVSRPTYAGGLGFGYKWDMGWMHDTLRYLARDPIHRKHHQGELSFRMMYAFSENYVLSLSHDEVVHGKGSLLDRMPGDRWQKFANLRLLYGNMFASPGKKLLFMGQEFAQPSEWNHDASLDWHCADEGPHAGVLRWVRDLNTLYRETPALHALDCDPAGFEWIDYADAERSVFAFLRHGTESGEVALAVANYTPMPSTDYRIGVPRAGEWRVVANSDAAIYGGSGFELADTFIADAIPWHGRSHSIVLNLPPLAIVLMVLP